MPTVKVIKESHESEIIRCSSCGCSRIKPLHVAYCSSSTSVDSAHVVSYLFVKFPLLKQFVIALCTQYRLLICLNINRRKA